MSNNLNLFLCENFEDLMVKLGESCGRQEKMPFKLLPVVGKWLEIAFRDYSFLQWFLVFFHFSQSRFLAVVLV